MKEENTSIAEGLSANPVDPAAYPRRGVWESPCLGVRFSDRETLHADVIDFFVDYLCREKQMMIKDILHRIEKGIISKALRAAQGNQRRAAAILGIKYTTLNLKIKKHRIKILRVPSI